MGEALEGVGEPSERVDLVELDGLDGAGDGGAVAAVAIGSGDQGVLAVERDRPDSTQISRKLRGSDQYLPSIV